MKAEFGQLKERFGGWTKTPSVSSSYLGVHCWPVSAFVVMVLTWLLCVSFLELQSPAWVCSAQCIGSMQLVVAISDTEKQLTLTFPVVAA